MNESWSLKRFTTVQVVETKGCSANMNEWMSQHTSWRKCMFNHRSNVGFWGGNVIIWASGVRAVSPSPEQIPLFLAWYIVSTIFLYFWKLGIIYLRLPLVCLRPSASQNEIWVPGIWGKAKMLSRILRGQQQSWTVLPVSKYLHDFESRKGSCLARLPLKSLT